MTARQRYTVATLNPEPCPHCGSSAWATGGYLSLLGDGTNYAIRDQQVTVAGADQGDEHALAIYVYRGTATLKVGSSAGGSQLRACSFFASSRRAFASSSEASASASASFA